MLRPIWPGIVLLLVFSLLLGLGWGALVPSVAAADVGLPQSQQAAGDVRGGGARLPANATDALAAPVAPAGLMAASLAVTKTLVSPADRTVLLSGETVTFQVVIENTGDTDIVYLPQQDQFSNACLSYSSKTASPPESYFSNGAGTIDWVNLIYVHGAYLAPGEKITTTIPFEVKSVVAPTNGSNAAVIAGAVDANNATVPTVFSEVEFTCAPPASIGDRVWDDVDGDGVQDGGEPGLSGVVVRLTKPDSSVITATTTITGFYNFTMLPPGAYTVTVDATTLPAGYVLTTGNLPFNVTLSAGDAVANADFGYQEQADLAVTKSDSPDPVTAGTTLTYTLVVANNGPADAVNIRITDTLPSGVAFVSATGDGWTLAHASGTVTGTRTTLVNAASSTITVVVTVNSDVTSTLTNNVTVSNDVVDPVPGNNSDSEDTTVNTSADLAVTKSDSPDPVTAGTTLTYTLVVANNGPSDALNVRITDTLPSGVAFVSATGDGWTLAHASGTVTGTRATLVNAASSTITVVVTVNSNVTSAITNNVTVGSDTPDANSGNNSDSEPTDVNTSADLSIAKSDTPDPVSDNNPLTYTLTIHNAGPSDALSVTVTDTLPSGVTWVSSVASQGSCSGTSSITCSLGTLVVNASAYITIVVTVNDDATSPLTNTAGVTASTSDPNTANNFASADTTVDHPSIAIAKTPDLQVVFAGSTVTFTIAVTNTGDVTLTAVSVADPLAPDCVRSLGTLAPGEPTSFTCTVTASSDFTNTATATGTPRSGADVSASDTARVLLYVRIGDMAYLDTNGNGTQEVTETFGIPYVSIHIVGLDVVGNSVDITVTTSVTGYYSTALVPGTYTVTAPASWPGFVRTSAGELVAALPTGGSQTTTVDFGYQAPTAVQLASFEAVPALRAVNLAWRVWLNGGSAAPEFYVARSAGGDAWKRLSAQPVRAASSDSQMATYGFADDSAAAGKTYWYRLEDTRGNLYGPWQVSAPALNTPRFFLPLVNR